MALEDLIKNCKKNNIDAQKQLYELYSNALYTLSLKYCRNKAEAEDNLHDSFMEIFKNINQYKHKGSFEGWMKRITINKAIDRYKSNKLLNVEINDDLLKDTSIEKIDKQISLNDLLRLINELPDRYRLVFSLYELDDFSHKEISKMLDISESGSKSNLHRAKAILKNKLENMKGSLRDTVKNYE